MRIQIVGTMTRYRTESHYPGIELTSPCLILLMPNASLGSYKHQFDKSLVWLDRESFHSRAGILTVRLSRFPGAINLFTPTNNRWLLDWEVSADYDTHPSWLLQSFIYKSFNDCNCTHKSNPCNLHMHKLDGNVENMKYCAESRIWRRTFFITDHSTTCTP